MKVAGKLSARRAVQVRGALTRAEAQARLVCGRSRGQRAREAGVGSWGTEDLEGQGGKTGFYSERGETFLGFSLILLGSRKNLLR